MIDQERIQEIHDDVREDFEKLTSLLIVAKSLYDEHPNIRQGMDYRIDGVIDDIKGLLKGRYPCVYYLSLLRKVGRLIGFVDGCCFCDKLDGSKLLTTYASTFGSWRAFDAEYSDEYFSVFLPLLKDFADENPDLFA